MAVTIDGVGEINGVVLPTTSFGKVLQVVRATDATNRTTTSTTYTDVTGVSVTITPTKSDSTILIGLFGQMQLTWTSETVHQYGYVQITDSANTAISGAEGTLFGRTRATSGDTRNWWTNLSMFAWATPATTSAVTYKARFKVALASSGVSIQTKSGDTTTQLYAIEVSA